MSGLIFFFSPREGLPIRQSLLQKSSLCLGNLEVINLRSNEEAIIMHHRVRIQHMLAGFMSQSVWRP